MNTAIPRDHLTITARGSWVAEEIPPRCRKPRPVSHETTATTSVSIVTAEQAPVAFRVRTHSGPEQEQVIRLYLGRLFTRYTHHDGSAHEFPTELDTDHCSLWPTADCALVYQMSFDCWAARFLIIRSVHGDEVWETIGEPRYLVTTFGMSHNHGGTALMSATDDHPGHRADSYFRADDFEAARAHAEDMARQRGDTDSLGSFRREIEVLVPEAVTLQTIPPTPRQVDDLRFDYQCATRRLCDAASHPGHEGPAFAEVTRLRQAIISTGYPVAPDDSRPMELLELRELEQAYTGT